MNIPIAHSTESLERFLQHIIDAPTPSNVTVQYLRDNGFTSGNDPELRHIFRLLGFLTESGSPRKTWEQYKEEGKEILRQAVDHCYAELFTLYPDASFSRSDDELKLWFRPPVTGSSRTSVERAIRTFRKLCVLAGIKPDNRIKTENPSPNAQSSLSKNQSLPEKQQLIIQIPPLGSRAEYEQLLEAVKQVFYN